MIASSVLTLTLLAQAQNPTQEANEVDTRFGHSSHGAAFDSGMRTKPWKIEGVGDVNFPITTTHQETQGWFNQGIALMHNFWYEEARRSFRWCMKLEPENPMAYWALGFCATYDYGSGGAADNFKKAYELRFNASPREQQIIEIYYNGFASEDKSRNQFRKDIRALVDQYPEDIEIRALHLREDFERVDPKEAEALIEEIFNRDPDHPGANHFLIHVWDAKDSERALRACRIYGDIAPASGHANHMPGHIYSKIGMWKEAAWAMDKAARVELKYMNDRLALPFETWNYSHNRNYLLYIQEHLGLADRAVQGALNLLTSPRDPQYNNLRGFGEGNQGLIALTRALIRFERWEEILDPQGWEWPEDEQATRLANLARVHALIETGDLVPAQSLLAEIKKSSRGNSNRNQMDHAILDAKISLARGRVNEVEEDLTKAVEAERKMHRGFYQNDPPSEPLSAHVIRGNFYLTRGKTDQATKDFDQALEYLPGNPWAIAGLAKAFNQKGDKRLANRYAGQFFYLWEEADADLPLLQEMKDLFPEVDPVPVSTQTERPYRPAMLDKFGPSDWQPFDAPKLEGVASDGRPISLDQYRGKNVIVVFYLSDECVHCMEQLVALNEDSDKFANEDTVILAVSSTPPSENAASEKLADLNVVLVSDFNHENARRWSSYDDFEEMELHSTVFVDREGKVRWKRTGGDPFDNVPFLLKEIRRVNDETN